MMTSTNKRDGGEVERGDALKLLIGTYWQIAYNEGRQGRTTDTTEGDAQRTWSQIEALIDAQERALAESRVLPSDMPRALTRAREWCEMYLAEKTRAERLAGFLRKAMSDLEAREADCENIDWLPWWNDARAALEQEPRPALTLEMVRAAIVEEILDHPGDEEVDPDDFSGAVIARLKGEMK